MGIYFGGIVDVSIGLAFLYLSLSLICTTLNEIVATGLKLRAKLLSAAVKKLLDEPAGGELLQRFYQNGLIRGTLASSHANLPEPSGVPAPGKHSSYLDSRNFAMALLTSLDPKTPMPAITDLKAMVEKIDGAAAIPAGVKDVLAAALAMGETDIAKLRDHIALWFDTAMDRLAGEYKRQLRLISLGAGLAVAVGLNADSIAVGKAIWNDGDREIVRQVGEMLPEISQVNAAACASPPGSANEADAGAEMDCRLRRLADQLDNLRPLPIGWGQETVASPPSGAAGKIEVRGCSVLDMAVKLVGWLITALALSLGAPFWFDMLNKVMNIRGAGTPPQKAKET
ncbi:MULTISPECIES: hypothetical protein [Agrobacterium]|uniref:Uncharacterized protein n=1 Tax=Agrobacterium tumefaciens TaxID=358 RepID=A0AAE6BEH3_AGRTU|nr:MULTISPECIES: hypothetical protein [Agrobacterium]QCL73953.1 hypothetical protein CFBP5499_11385 [Agrobacterium tumefaciens]QCL79529.1 hypothetical protein CFBP5877_10915 [Agrobacterium tumefaciens]CUX34462.1 membrane hypothetical protein [Agrobacterium sp. NCPPB 925]